MKRRRKGRTQPASSTSDVTAPVGSCSKRRKLVAESAEIQHDVLSSYYPVVTSLRHYLLAQLTKVHATKRRKQLLRKFGGSGSAAKDAILSNEQDFKNHNYSLLSADYLLDHVIIGEGSASSTSGRDEHSSVEHAFTEFLQQASTCAARTSDKSDNRRSYTIDELVDFTIWLLFYRQHSSSYRPSHILCYGYRRSPGSGLDAGRCVPGLTVVCRNEHIDSFKSSSWQEILDLLGDHGIGIMTNLLIKTGMFVPLSFGSTSIYQQCGVPLSELSILQNVANDVNVNNTHRKPGTSRPCKGAVCAVRRPSAITFVRYRMLYARASLNAKGTVRFGLRHIHVFNRFPDSNDDEHTRRLMQYIFPRQFRLHNVFTSAVDLKDTAQPFKDYMMREHEIAHTKVSRNITSTNHEGQSSRTSPLPRRLRGPAFNLVRKMHKRHQRTSYTELLRHYCSAVSELSPDRRAPAQNAEEGFPHFSRLATPNASVSAFCRAAISKVVPWQLIGCDGPSGWNWQRLMKLVDLFISARRFESFTLEHFLQGMKISLVSWLKIPGQAVDSPMALSDSRKRTEIFAELIYYIIDSFLIPTIRSNFYVTESGTHRHRLFYFRQDIWKRMSEPGMTALKSTMLEEVKLDEAMILLNTRAQGYSQIRFLPKAQGMRSIMNLRRRAHVMKHGTRILGRSINSVVAPAFHVLNHEKSNQPYILGSSLFSVGGMFKRLRSFSNELRAANLAGIKLFFVKVDVRSCFDTLPQDLLLRLVSEVLSSEEYELARFTEFKAALGSGSHGKNCQQLKPLKKFHSIAYEAGQEQTFRRLLDHTGRHRLRSVTLVDHVSRNSVPAQRVMELLIDHVQNNIVKIGKKYYRQRIGIPQGSILSSILCNIGYADFERQHLGFLEDEPCLLLRLIDDFLLITPSKAQAERYLSVMQRGGPDHGIEVKSEKTLTNFISIHSRARHGQVNTASTFPYCGVMIDESSLRVTKDYRTERRGDIQDTLTVEHSKSGSTFRRKILSGLKIQMLAMLVDASHNGMETVLQSLYKILQESALRSLHYIKSLSRLERPNRSLLNALVNDVAALAYGKLRACQSKDPGSEPRSSPGRNTVLWLTLQAFISVLEAKQASFKMVLRWAKRKAKSIKHCSHAAQGAMRTAMRSAEAVEPPRRARADASSLALNSKFRGRRCNWK